MKTINVNKLGDTGRFGEDAAVKHLIDLGYEIIGRNVICSGNEIDIVARDMRYIVFVEVKTRKTYDKLSRFGPPRAAVNREKQNRIISAARAYLKESPQRRIPRFDVIEVYVDYVQNNLKVNKINHVPRAFGSWR